MKSVKHGGAILLLTIAAIGSAAEAATLQLVRETKISALGLPSLPGNEYEASGIVKQGDYLYVIFDNSYRILKVKPDWTSASLTSVSSDSSSQYEAITYDAHQTTHFYAMVESAVHNGANTGELDRYSAQLTNRTGEWTNVTFNKANKGFEGAAWLWNCPTGSTQGNDYILGLCEANDCDDVGNTGHGRIKVMAQNGTAWSLISNGTLAIPSRANFGDYSDIALYPPYPQTNDCSGVGGDGSGVYTVAVVSQESSQLWIGTLNAKTWTFQDDGTLYDFPKNQQGQTIYCNVEGVTFLSATQIAVASDAKKDGQPDVCSGEDQSLHIFTIPQ